MIGCASIRTWSSDSVPRVCDPALMPALADDRQILERDDLRSRRHRAESMMAPPLMMVSSAGLLRHHADETHGLVDHEVDIAGAVGNMSAITMVSPPAASSATGWWCKCCHRRPAGTLPSPDLGRRPGRFRR
jgi:hypothetical protein